MPKSKKRILGIDPGTNVLGYAMIDVDGNKLILVEMGVIKMSHLESHQLKLKRIFEKLQSLIKAYGPKEMAVEAPFYGKNPQSMLKLGRAQGVAIAAGITLDVPVKEYAPKKIKQSITGTSRVIPA
ncbi:MAG: crossover junction endodeoxyribonuclease RuvC, partial [Bacteroidota bacterium]